MIYIAGHGLPRTPNTNETNYLAAYDTVVKPTATSDLYRSALSLVELSDFIAGTVTSRHVAIFIDTCATGGQPAVPAAATSINRTSISEQVRGRITQGTGRIVIVFRHLGTEFPEPDHSLNKLLLQF